MKKSATRPARTAYFSCGGRKLYVTIDVPWGTVTLWYTPSTVVMSTFLPLTEARHPAIDSSVRNNVEEPWGHWTCAWLTLVLVTVHVDEAVEKKGRELGTS